MKHKTILTFLIFIVIAAFVAGCAEQEVPVEEEEKAEEMREAETAIEEDDNGDTDDQATISIDENDLSEDSDQDEASADYTETEPSGNSDTAEAQEFSPTANPYQVFNQARTNRVPIVLKFYSET